MAKYTNKLNAVTERINDAIKSNGLSIKIGHRNGYTAIDLYDLKTEGMKDYVNAGLTDKQAIDYLHAMIKGMNLLHGDKY
jgi:hypothetical protein